MGRKKDQPAPPVEQKSVDPAPSIQEAAQPPEDEPAAPGIGPKTADAVAALLADPELQHAAQEGANKLMDDIESLADYAARIEEEAQPLPVCQITHPDAKDGGLHIGKYAGIRLVRGDAPAALLSDGSTI